MTENNHEGEKVSLKILSEICNFVGKISESVMDENSTALIIGSTGEITFTRNSCKILSESCCNHPIAKVILNAAYKYHKETGYDCDLFLFLLKEVIACIARETTNLEEMHLRRTFYVEIIDFIQVLPFMFKKIHHLSNVQVLNSASDMEHFKNNLKSILFSFMISKFSLSVSEILGNLVYSMIWSSLTEWYLLKETVEYLISYFDTLCVKVIAPLEESSVVEGFVFNKNVSLPDKCLENIRYVMVLDLSRDTLCTSGWKINPESFEKELDYYYNQYKKVLAYYKLKDIILLLSPSVANEDLKSACVENNVILIDRLGQKDFDTILFSSEISALDNLADIVQSENIGTLKSINHLTCFESTYVQIKIASFSKLFVPNNFLLCAHLGSLWKEYYNACLDSLKVVKTWFHPESSHLFPKASQLSNFSSFETAVHALKLDDLTLSMTDMHGVPPKRDLLCDFNKNLNQKINFEKNLLCSSLPVGLWEIWFKCIAEHVKKHSSSSFPLLNKVICIAFSNLVCKKYKVSFPCTDSKLKKSCFSYQKRMAKKVTNFVEPLASKEILVYSVMQLIFQLLKIDSIIKTK